MIYRIFSDPAAEGQTPEVSVTPSGDYVKLEIVSNVAKQHITLDGEEFPQEFPPAVFIQKTAAIYLCEDGIRVEF